MKRTIIISLLAVAFLVPALTLASPLIRSGDTVTIKNSETVSDDAYLAGGMLTMTGNVAGDFVGAGGNLFVAGSTQNDVMIAGGSLTVVGAVGDDLRAAGGNVTILSSVGDDVIVAGGQVSIVSGAVVGGDLIVTGGQVTVDGTVHGSVRVMAGDVSINGTTGDVSVKAERIVIGSKARINGALDYSSARKAEIHDGSIIAGPVTFTEMKPQKRNLAGLISMVLILKFLSLFVTALVLQWVLRKMAVRIVADSLKGVWGNLGRGFVALIVMPAAFIVLCMTVIGIPLALIVLFSYIALMIFSCVFVSVFLGGLMHKLYKKSETIVLNWKTALMGSVAAFILGLIPVVGCLALFVAFLIILGTLVHMKMRYLKDFRQSM